MSIGSDEALHEPKGFRGRGMKMNFPNFGFNISRSLGLASVALLTCGPAQAEWGGDSSVFLADELTSWVGYSEMTGDSRDMLALSIYIFALIFGVLTRMNLGDMAFGRAAERRRRRGWRLPRALCLRPALSSLSPT